jgi:hypothetical protein
VRLLALALLVGKCQSQQQCPYEEDQECDVPIYCPEGTDLVDCEAGAVEPTCSWEGDGACDVPAYCPAGTDLADCAGNSGGNSGSGE